MNSMKASNQLKPQVEQITLRPPANLLQRTCACGQHTIGGSSCNSCRQKSEGSLQRSTKGRESVSDMGAPPIVQEVLRSSGESLAAGARASMEPRLGQDFSRVRVHTDAPAAASAAAVKAMAYTVGRDIVFGAGQYAPGSNAGQRLLAHELTHVMQQGAQPYDGSHELALGPAHDAFEHQADAVAARGGTRVDGTDHRFNPGRPSLQRQPKPAATSDKKEKPAEIKITPATRTIPQAEVDKPLPIVPAPTGLPDKSPGSKAGATPDKNEEGSGIETSIEGSAAEKKITTNIEVSIPVTPIGKALVFGQPLVLGKELKFVTEIGAKPPAGGLGSPQQAAFKISYKALSYEIESLKSRVKGLEDFGLGVSAEAEIDPANPLARPDLSVKGGLEASYQIGRTPFYLQGSVGYEVKLPAQGPATAAPTADFGFKIKF